MQRGEKLEQVLLAQDAEFDDGVLDTSPIPRRPIDDPIVIVSREEPFREKSVGAAPWLTASHASYPLLPVPSPARSRSRHQLGHPIDYARVNATNPEEGPAPPRADHAEARGRASASRRQEQRPEQQERFELEKP